MPKQTVLEKTGEYIWNPLTKKVTFLTESKFGKDITYSFDTVEKILKLYSNYDRNPHTVQEIQKKTGIPRDRITHILKVLNKTHDSLPVIEELIEDEDQTVEELILSKEQSVAQKFEKVDWKRTVDDAEKWREFKANLVNPIESFLNNWNPPLYKSPKKKRVGGKYSLIASLQDIHLGELTKKEHLFHGGDYNSDIATKIVDDYCEKIIADVYEKNQDIAEAVLIICGDFLHTAMHGTTAQGTKLTSDLLNEDLFQRGLEILVKFVSRFNEEFPKVTVKFLRGNHEGTIGSYLGYAVQQYFRTDMTVSVEVVKSWATLFKVGKLAVIATHGGSDTIHHANIPRNEAQMKTYFQEMMLAKRRDIVDCEHTIVVSGHSHSFVNKDMGAFDFYVMGTTVLGDKFADNMNFPRGKPRQNALIVKDGKVMETLHYYFD